MSLYPFVPAPLLVSSYLLIYASSSLSSFLPPSHHPYSRLSTHDTSYQPTPLIYSPSSSHLPSEPSFTHPSSHPYWPFPSHIHHPPLLPIHAFYNPHSPYHLIIIPSCPPCLIIISIASPNCVSLMYCSGRYLLSARIFYSYLLTPSRLLCDTGTYAADGLRTLLQLEIATIQSSSIIL
ncbi:hypothetical protein C8J57DRAFT_1658339 [Mycena rebaudengoi]|nr:hypothetical protein C8J57DRAFT_1658339 [Mycena rebaudengoi]